MNFQLFASKKYPLGRIFAFCENSLTAEFFWFTITNVNELSYLNWRNKMAFRPIDHGVSISDAAWNSTTQEIFTSEFTELLGNLHRKFGKQRKHLLELRKERQARWDRGELPGYDTKSIAVTTDWRVASIPTDLQKRRVEITGPVNDPKMVINMLSRNSEGHRADTAMLDFEDSMKPSFNNVIDGIKNVIAASTGHLSYSRHDGTKTYELDEKDMAGLMVRVRGLHLEESNVLVDSEPLHGGMLDLAACFFFSAKNLIERKKTPKYYIPKCEHHLEARWWNELFTELETSLGYQTGTLRATFLIETLPAAFQVEEILYETRDHIVGLNVGRWDKIFSDIKVLGRHPDRISADRAEINMSKFWMDNYAKRLIKICHARGAYAIGGMSAFTPGKDPEVRRVQTEKVRADKENEARIGHDGCWVSHPYFIGHAMSAFTRDHQLDVKLEDFDRFPDLIMDGKGPRTLEGLRTNVRVGIAYMEGWRKDIGCVAWDNLMEDLATLEISRAQTWQWKHHQVRLESGEVVDATLIERIFSEELEKIKSEIQVNGSHLDPLQRENRIRSFDAAARTAQELFVADELKEFLATSSDLLG